MADSTGSVGLSTRRVALSQNYAAFISYSHADEEIANALHKRLEHYRIPAALESKGRRRIGKVFRDRVDLSAAHDLGGEIRKALDVSDALILLCSPRSAKSKYVAEEIRYFKQRGLAHRIFAVIVDGEPHAAGKPGRTADDECFPNAMLYQVDTDGQLTATPEAREPIAADVRTDRDGLENGALKLIAGLIGVGLDELVQREKQAEAVRRRRVQLVAGVFAILAAAAVAAGGYAWWQYTVAQAETRRAETNEQRALRGEKAAIVSAEAERASAAAARIAQDQAVAEAIRATTAEGVARMERDKARSILHRFFAARAWDKIRAGDQQAAVRYALAGYRLSPANRQVYEAAIAAAIFASEAAVARPADSDARARLGSPFTPVPRSRASAMHLFKLGDEGANTIMPIIWDKLAVVVTPGYRLSVWESAGIGSDWILRWLVNVDASEVKAIAISKDGRRVFAGTTDGTVKVWDTSDGTELGSVSYSNSVMALSYGDDAKRLAVAYGTSPFEWSDTLEWDVSLLVDHIDILARDACGSFLERGTFSREEIRFDPLLASEWPDSSRDVCEGNKSARSSPD